MNHTSHVRTSRILITAVTLWLTPACFAGKVQAWPDKSVDFSQFKTYQWLPPKLLSRKGVVDDDPEITTLVKDSVNRELQQRGLKEVQQGGDLEVSTLVLAQAVAQLEGYLFQGPTPDFFTAPVATVGRYNHEGTLVVNLIDTKTQRSAWCGMATESVSRDPGEARAKIPTAARKLFKKYPKSSKQK